MRTTLLLLTMMLGGLVFGTGRVFAAISYGTGTYVNLCGSGTAADRYTCDAGCNPTTGTCQSSNRGVVKYVCPGRWDQCLDAEGYWSNSESIGQMACGQTVQLSLYDKSCRLEDGSWDSSCQIKGYMVWYSGDCWNGTGAPPTPLPTRPVSTPTGAISPTPRLSVTPSPSPRVTATVSPTLVRACGKTCSNDSACGAGFTCVSGVCRNPSCPSDKSCFCGKTDTSTSSANTQTPDTGGEIWVVIGVAGLAGMGLVARRFSKALW